MSKRYNMDDIDRLHQYDLHIGTRTVSIFSVHTGLEGEESGVESALAEKAIKNITILEGISKEPINVLLNTPGGDHYHGMAIYDMIKSCKSHVTIKGIGQIMSMGAVILQSADTRLLYPNTRIMVHYGQAGFHGHARTMQKWSDEFKKIDFMMEAIFLDKIRERNPDFDIRSLRKMLDHDSFFSAEEAIGLGLADGLVTDG